MIILEFSWTNVHFIKNAECALIVQQIGEIIVEFMVKAPNMAQ